MLKRNPMNYHVYGIYIINYRFWYKTSLDFTCIAHLLVEDELMTISNPMIARLKFSHSIIKKKKKGLAIQIQPKMSGEKLSYPRCHEPCLWSGDGDGPVEHGVQEPEILNCMNRKSLGLQWLNTKSQLSIQGRWRHMEDLRVLEQQLKLTSGNHSAAKILYLMHIKLNTRVTFGNKLNPSQSDKLIIESRYIAHNFDKKKWQRTEWSEWFP